MSKKKLTKGQKISMAYQRMNNQSKIQEELDKKKSKKTVWERRGQTEAEYKKSQVKDDYKGTSTLTEEQIEITAKSLKRDSNKKPASPNSVQSLKKKLRSVKGTGKFLHEGKLVKATSKLIRETVAKK